MQYWKSRLYSSSSHKRNHLLYLLKNSFTDVQGTVTVLLDNAYEQGTMSIVPNIAKIGWVIAIFKKKKSLPPTTFGKPTGLSKGQFSRLVALLFILL